MLKNIPIGIKLAGSMLKAFNAIRSFKPDAVIGVGGYASGPTLKIAQMLGIFKECQLYYLKKICFSGSIIPNNVIMDWQKHLPKTCMVNQYGPTEATASCL